MFADTAYFNIHTIQFPGGEIRGFLHAVQSVPEPGSLVLLGLGLACSVSANQATREVRA